MEAQKVKTLPDLRYARGYSLTQVAERLDLSRSMVHRLENGTRRLSLDTAARLANIYGVSIEDIYNLHLGKATKLAAAYKEN